MRSRVLCAVCALAALTLYLFTRTTAAMFFLCASIIFPAAALPLAATCSGKVSISLNLPTVIEKGKPTHGSLLIENHSLIPAAEVAITLHVRNTLTGREDNILITRAVPPRGQSEVKFILESACCGQHLISCDEFRVFDFLGLHGIRVRAAIMEKRVVPPETFSMQATLSGGESPLGSSEIFSMSRIGHDQSEPFQIRDYAEGDSLRQIHWKLSQKLDRYIVTDPSLELEHALLVFWDSASFSQGISPHIPDALAESLVSLCLALAEDEIPHSVAWKSGDTGDIVLKDVGTLDDVYDVMSGILCTNTGDSETTLLPELLRELGGRVYPKIAYFTHRISEHLDEQNQAGQITVFLCADDAGDAFSGELDCRVFSPANYRSILQNVTI